MAVGKRINANRRNSADETNNNPASAQPKQKQDVRQRRGSVELTTNIEVGKLLHATSTVVVEKSDSLFLSLLGFICRCTIRSPPANFIRTYWFKLMIASITMSTFWCAYGHYCQYAINEEAKMIYADLEPGMCPVVDNSNTNDIGAAIHEFFEIEFPKNPDYEGVNYYPWVLTMTAALRFGGNAVHDGDDLFMADHDIDIMLAGEPMTDDLAWQIEQELVAYIGKKCNMWTFVHEESSYHHATAYLMRWSDFSQIGFWQISSGVTRILTRNLRDFDAWYTTLAADIVDTYWLRNFVAGPLWSHLTVIDFHTKNNKTMPAHAERKVKWANKSWPYPEKENDFVYYFNRYVSRFNFADVGVRDVCDLYEPQYRWVDDTLSDSPKKYEIFETCADQLEAEGFYSLGHCKNYKSVPPTGPYSQAAIDARKQAEQMNAVDL